MRKLILLLSVFSALGGCNMATNEWGPGGNPFANGQMGAMGTRLLAAGQPMTSAQRASVLSGSPMPATETYLAPAPMTMQRPVQTNCSPNGNMLQCSTY
jgi:hypothetical protein